MGKSGWFGDKIGHMLAARKQYTRKSSPYAPYGGYSPRVSGELAARARRRIYEDSRNFDKAMARDIAAKRIRLNSEGKIVGR